MRDFKKILNNQSGVALMMVMTSILILTAIMVDFTYEGHINKFKGINIENRGQAKLTAEAGLKFAMTRLRLYKEAFNILQKNKNAQSFVSQKLINSIWSFPFAYPIPANKNLNSLQKDAIKKFNDSTFLEGNMNLVIQNISNKINLNLIRISLLNDSQADIDEEEVNDNSQYDAEKQLLDILNYKIENKSEKDEAFSAQYYGMDVIALINNLKYYVSDPESLVDDSGIQTDFTAINLTPKRAPITSFQELYMLPGWSDELAELIQNEFTIHGAIMIDINKINDAVLRLLIPEINEDEISEFFKYRDDPKEPHFFNKLEDFKNYVVSKASLMNSQVFDERFNKFKSQGLQFGPSPSLFKISSTGTVGRATYTIVAYVSLPATPVAKKKVTPPPPTDETDNPEDPETPKAPTESNPENGNNDKKEEQITQLLEPRILEIFIN